MKKLALVLCAGLFLATAANAQSLQLGVKAGANFSNVSGNGTQGVSTSTMVGFNAGAYLGIGISENFFIQPELVYFRPGIQGIVKRIFRQPDRKLPQYSCSREV